MEKILTGISSWADPGLVASGRFYPKDVRTPADRLRYYSEQFPIAEIDSSFHFFPTARNLALWLDNTPLGFTFDIRAYSLFTGHPTQFSSLPASVRRDYPDLPGRKTVYLHHLPEAAVERLWEIFLNYTATMERAGKLGVVLFQFPPWFHPSEENREYVLACCRRLSGYRLAVEFRTGDWLAGDTLETTLTFLKHHGIALVCVDEPQGLKTSVLPVAAATAPVAMVRFHGRNTDTWEKRGGNVAERFMYLYNRKELEEWAEKVRELSAATEKVHVIFKNKYEDYSVRNTREFMELLAQ